MKPIMTRLTAGALLCFAAVLSGCGWLGLRDRGDDYQLADSLPPLQMPAGVTTKHQEELYEVPQVASNALERGKFETPRPQPLATNIGQDRVKIQKLGNRRWVLVSQPPDQVWPQLSFFLRSSGLNLERADATAGIMETTWLQFEQSPDTKDKYRLQVEAGVQPDTTEVHVRHLSVPADAQVGGSVNWPAQSTSPEREGWMIDEMSTTLAAESTGAAASLVAQAIGGGSVKVQLQEPAGRDPYISLGLPMDRARATVAHALNVGAYRLHREDAAIGIYYVTYDEDRELTDEEGGGWFSWGSKDKDEDKLAEAAEGVTLQQVLANIDPTADPELFADMPGVGDAPAAQSRSEFPGYLVVLHGDDGRIQVRVRSSSGQPLSRARASQLLMAIRQNLI